ncbi:MAG: hypothetical protein JNG84_06580 [Archangium sp.]|nr:hypothetical protein [Archangium sp.]
MKSKNIIRFTKPQLKTREALKALAVAHRAAGGGVTTEPEREMVDQWRKLLLKLVIAGWKGGLGKDAELPDPLMPPPYIEQRTKLLDLLYKDLLRLTVAYRGGDRAYEKAVCDEYARVYDEMERIGHWSGEPGFDAELPEDLMPASYRKVREQLFAAFQVQFADEIEQLRIKSIPEILAGEPPKPPKPT